MLSDLDRALQRYHFLKKIADEHALRAATGSPRQLYAEIGVTVAGEKTERARAQVASFHDDLAKTIEQLGFLGIVAAFEAAIADQISNAVGAARGVIRAEYPLDIVLAKQAEGLVRDVDSFGSIKAVEELISAYLGAPARDALAKIRGERNRLAHGTSDQPVGVSPDHAHRVLTAILRDTGPQR